MTNPLPASYFVADGDVLAPTFMAKGPWGSSISGNFIGGVLAHAIEPVSYTHLTPVSYTHLTLPTTPYV